MNFFGEIVDIIYVRPQEPPQAKVHHARNVTRNRHRHRYAVHQPRSRIQRRIHFPIRPQGHNRPY